MLTQKADSGATQDPSGFAVQNALDGVGGSVHEGKAGSPHRGQKESQVATDCVFQLDKS